MDRVAASGKELQTDLHHRALACVTEFGMEVHAMSTQTFLMVLLGDEDTPKPYLRVPLLLSPGCW